MVWVKRGLNDHLIPPPFSAPSLNFLCAVQAAEPAPLPFFLESDSTGSSLSQQVLPSVIPEFPLLSRAWVLGHTQPGRAGALPSPFMLHHPFLLGLAEGSWALGDSSSAAVE